MTSYHASGADSRAAPPAAHRRCEGVDCRPKALTSLGCIPTMKRSPAITASRRLGSGPTAWDSLPWPRPVDGPGCPLRGRARVAGEPAPDARRGHGRGARASTNARGAHETGVREQCRPPGRRRTAETPLTVVASSEADGNRFEVRGLRGQRRVARTPGVTKNPLAPAPPWRGGARWRPHAPPRRRPPSTRTPAGPTAGAPPPPTVGSPAGRWRTPPLQAPNLGKRCQRAMGGTATARPADLQLPRRARRRPRRPSRARAAPPRASPTSSPRSRRPVGVETEAFARPRTAAAGPDKSSRMHTRPSGATDVSSRTFASSSNRPPMPRRRSGPGARGAGTTRRPPQLLAGLGVVGHDDARRGSRPGAAAPARERLADRCWASQTASGWSKAGRAHRGRLATARIGPVAPQ